jgi:hypothetical protein
LPLLASSPTNFGQPDHLVFQLLLETSLPAFLAKKLYIAVTMVEKQVAGSLLAGTPTKASQYTIALIMKQL